MTIHVIASIKRKRKTLAVIKASATVKNKEKTYRRSASAPSSGPR
jgi:hypothetical protein